MYIKIVTTVYHIRSQTHIRDSHMYDGSLSVIIMFVLCGMYIHIVLIIIIIIFFILAPHP